MLIVFTEKQISSDDLIRRGIQEYCALFNVAPFPYRIVREDGKKPRLDVEDLYINLSHSKAFTFVAISREEVGIDIQYHSDRVDTLGISQRFYKRTVTDKKLFYDLWAQKESIAKRDGAPLIPTLGKECYSTLIAFKNDYSLAVAGNDTDILLTEIL